MLSSLRPLGALTSLFCSSAVIVSAEYLGLVGKLEFYRAVPKGISTWAKDALATQSLCTWGPPTTLLGQQVPLCSDLPEQGARVTACKVGLVGVRLPVSASLIGPLVLSGLGRARSWSWDWRREPRPELRYVSQLHVLG